MTEAEALSLMVPPGKRRPTKWLEGVIQIHVTRACDKACFGCTQGSQLAGKSHFMSPEQFEAAVLSLDGYFGVVGVFGGNPAVHPRFEALCEILARHVPFERRGLWCNKALGKGAAMRRTFNPAYSNLNCHLDRDAYDEFRRDWPEAHPFGHDRDSRHSPPYVAMRDVLKKDCGCDMSDTCGRCNNTRQVYDEAAAWELISRCDVNQFWSAMIGVFRGELRAWFCEVAGAQSILHQDDPDYPDTGLDPTREHEHETAPGERLEKTVGKWWQLGMVHFARQVRKHCHECGVPLRGHGALAQDEAGTEQVSATHEVIFRPKRKGRAVELVTTRAQLGEGRIARATDYLGNSKR